MSLIDFAYQTTQTVLNKNHRGVLTPERFNVLARTALSTVYNNILNEYRTASNKSKTGRSGVDMYEVEQQLKRYLVSYNLGSGTTDVASITMPDNFSFFPKRYLFYKGNEVPEIPMGDLTFLNTSIVAPSKAYPQHERLGTRLDLYPALENDEIKVRYFKHPDVPNWTYMVINDEPIFNESDNAYVDLDIHEHRLPDVIVEILELAGVHIRENVVIQVSEAIKNSQFNKDNTP